MVDVARLAAGFSGVSKNDLDESYKLWLERISVEKNYRITHQKMQESLLFGQKNNIKIMSKEGGVGERKMNKKEKENRQK